MKTFGLTGGIGMGKSTAARILVEHGVPVIDTDVIAREIVEPGQPALAEVRGAFGAAVTDDHGRLRRDELARIVFADAAARSELERILHPRIRERWRTQLTNWRTEDRANGVVIIPLLFETGAESEFDHTICVACTRRTQFQRLVPRGWSEEEIQKRIDAQWTVERKMELSDFVVWSEGIEDVLREQLSRIVY